MLGDRWDFMLVKYIGASSILLLLWYLNKYISILDYILKEKLGAFAFTVLVNLICISLFVSLDYFVVPHGITSEVDVTVLMVRLTLMSLILNVIIRVYNYQRERE